MTQVAQSVPGELIRADTRVLSKIHKETVVFDHNMLDIVTPDDDYLASVIARAAKAGPMHYNLSVVERAENGEEQWVQGLLARDGEKVDGKAVLALIRAGRLWLQVEHLAELAPEMAALARAAYDEIRRRTPGFTYFNLYCNLLISGPRAKVTPHIDVAEVFLFHLRGHKRFRLWDPEVFPVPDEWREGIILREQLEDIPLKPEWMDKGIEAVLGPGQGVNFPYMWPHAVDNLSELNVSLQTEFHYPATMRRYLALYARGLARRRLGLKVRRNLRPGSAAETLQALPGLMAKVLRLHAPKPRKVMLKFVVDAAGEGGVRWLPEAEQVAVTK